MTTPQFAVLAFILISLVVVNVLALVFHANQRQNLRPFRPASQPSRPVGPSPKVCPGESQPSNSPMPKAA